MAEPSAKRDGSESEKLSTNTLEDSKTVLENSEAPVPFTVTPVRQNSSSNSAGDKYSPNRNSFRKNFAHFELGDDGEAGDTQNSITSLLSSKFRDLSKRWKQYGEESPRFRKRLVSKWESLNYDKIDSTLHQQDNELQKKKSKRRLTFEWIIRWFMMFLVGIGTSLLAAGVHISVELVSHKKFLLIAKCIFLLTKPAIVNGLCAGALSCMMEAT